MADTLNIFGIEYTNVSGIIAKNPSETELTYVRPQGAKEITANGTGIDVTEYASVNVSVPSEEPSLQTKNKSYTPTTSQQTESITADSGYDGLSAVNITVSAMPSGTAGTPIATKGTVGNHSISITPSVSNTAGYIAGGTLTGTAVTVTASELVSGSTTITENGTHDVTNYASAIVSLEFSTIHTGSSDPSSSLGTNGDIYIKVTS